MLGSCLAPLLGCLGSLAPCASWLGRDSTHAEPRGWLLSRVRLARFYLLNNCPVRGNALGPNFNATAGGVWVGRCPTKMLVRISHFSQSIVRQLDQAPTQLTRGSISSCPGSPGPEPSCGYGLGMQSRQPRRACRHARISPTASRRPNKGRSGGLGQTVERVRFIRSYTAPTPDIQTVKWYLLK